MRPIVIERITSVALLAALLAACSGTKGDPGPAGTPGPVGPSGPPGGAVAPGVPPVTSAKSIRATISAVTIGADTRATVRFNLRSELDLPLRGLTAANLRLVIAQLRSGSAGRGSEWRAYTTRRDASQIQANAEPATTSGAVLRDNGDGTYDYTFARALNAYGPDGAAWDPALTHRVALELRSTTDLTLAAANNAAYTFVPATGSTTSLPLRREIVDNDTCFACHDRLEFHGGPRTDVQYCVTCHNPSTTDGQAPNNTLDMAVMVHKIHMGSRLTAGYRVTGFGPTVYEFGSVVYTQDPRNCATCHQESDSDTPQASNWRTTPYARACGACHDDVNFATGQGHGSANIPATDDQCITCHGPNATVQNGNLRPEVAHRIPEKEAAKDFEFQILKVEAVKADGTPGATPCPATTVGCTVLPGEFPRVTIRIRNPMTGAPYALSSPAFTPVTGAPAPRVRALVGHTTANYVNRGTGATPAQPAVIDFLSSAVAPMGAPASAGGPPSFDAAAGSYAKTASAPIAAGVLGTTGTAFLTGRAVIDVNPWDPTPSPTPQLAELAVKSSAPVNFLLTSAVTTPQARRAIVDVRRCDDCHNVLAFHGDQRNEQTELCALCHNSELAGGTSFASGEPFDFKFMIHSLHAGTYKFGRFDFSPTGTNVRYPGKLNNCEGCHQPNTYYPVDPARVFATSFARGTDASSPVDDPALSVNSAICSGCHTTTTAKLHMEQNGGDLNRAGLPNKNADGSFVNAVETCQLCHGPGRSADVKEVHDIGRFEFRAPVAN